MRVADRRRTEAERLRARERQEDWGTFLAGLGFIGGFVALMSGALSLGLVLFLVGVMCSALVVALDG